MAVLNWVMTSSGFHPPGASGQCSTHWLTSSPEFLLRFVGGLRPEHGEEALGVLAAGLAALEVGDDLGEHSSDVRASEHGLSVLVQDLEAGLAARIRRCASQQSISDVLVHLASRCPTTEMAARSLRRASCRVLYTAPRELPVRSAITSI